MNEFSFIDSIKQKSYKQASIIKGIGDDAAVFRQSTQDIVTAVDTFVEGIHFTRQTMEPRHVGYRALAVNVSDLAAMGASPAFYLVSIVIPETWSSDELHEIFQGMKRLATQHKMDLIGGDTVSGRELSISITVIGYVPTEKARYRSVAKEGDTVFVTGTLGDSQAGYHILTNPGNFTDADYYINKHRMPNPRIDFARNLENINRVALNDISDGIASEAAEIAEASNVRISIYENKLPTSESFKQFPEKFQQEWKLFGGEDFELLGTASKNDWQEIKEIADKTETPITEIGYVELDKPGSNHVFLHKNKRKLPLKKQGYTHLK